MTVCVPVSEVSNTLDTPDIGMEAEELQSRLDEATHRVIDAFDDAGPQIEEFQDEDLDIDAPQYAVVSEIEEMPNQLEVADHLAEHLDDPYRVVRDLSNDRVLVEKNVGGDADD